MFEISHLLILPSISRWSGITEVKATNSYPCFEGGALQGGELSVYLDISGRCGNDSVARWIDFGKSKVKMGQTGRIDLARRDAAT